MTWGFHMLPRLFRRSPKRGGEPRVPHEAEGSPQPEIDVRELIASTLVEGHCRRAEAYFARQPCLEELLAKPLTTIDDAPDLLFSFSALVRGLELFAGARVVDFGAGTCWASHALSQLGCRVIALDPSTTALRLGEELYRRRPAFGDTPEPTFLPFDGHRIELEAGTVDRVFCLDALHHVPNPEEVIAELGRILVDGGIAGFAEPGPNHSRTPHSQSEMRRYRVIENDIDLARIWSAARRYGFADLKVAVFHRPLFLLGLEPFEALLTDARGARRFAHETRAALANERIFFLYKRGERARDSRQAEGLHARIEVEPLRAELREGEPFEARVSVTNDGSAVWLPASAGVGGVSLGWALAAQILPGTLLPGPARDPLDGPWTREDLLRPRTADSQVTVLQPLVPGDSVDVRPGGFYVNGRYLQPAPPHEDRSGPPLDTYPVARGSGHTSAKKRSSS